MEDASQPGAYLPQIGKQVASDRAPQVLSAARSAGPRLGPDRPLDHPDMAVPPFGEALVQIHEALADLGGFRVAAVHVEQNVLNRGSPLNRRGHVAHQVRGRHRISFPRQITQESIPERRLPVPPLERGARGAPLRKAIEYNRVLGAEHEFDLPELAGLKAARGLEARSKRQK